MKNFIFLNYNIKVDKIYYKNNIKYFFVENEKIYIIENDYKEKYLEDLFKLTNDLFYQKINVNTFIINNNGKCYTKRNENKIVLLKENNIDSIDLNYLKKFQNKNNSLKNYDILHEWMNEVDILENEIVEYNNEFPLIRKSIDFFIGLAENAIELIDEYKIFINNNNDSIGHKINYELFKNNNINNPFLFIKTNSMYDISNYLKYSLLTNNVNFYEIDTIIDNNNEYQNMFLFSCLLYPNIYFDMVKNILFGNISEDIINNVINKIDKYINLLIY